MKTQTGFTLIEVLIAMMVLAIGLLGFAALQAFSVKNNLAAYTHGQAVQLLYDMSDRMRSNKIAAANYVTTNSNTTAAGITYNNDCTKATGTAACTSAVLANNDLFDWNAAITASTSNLPMGQGAITAVGTLYLLSITWDDNRDGAVDNLDPKLTMELQL
jgi:type IV pilus assembly protein PilV